MAIEQFSPKAYLDPPGNKHGQYSIGYGHLIQANERGLIKATWTKQQAQDQLVKDLAPKVAAVNKALKRPVDQNHADALYDFAYNAGEGNAAKVVGTWNATGDSTQLVNHIKQYIYVHVDDQPVKSAALIARRNYEANLIQGIGHAVSATTAGVIAAVEKKK